MKLLERNLGDIVLLINSLLFFDEFNQEVSFFAIKESSASLTETDCTRFWYKGRETFLSLNINLYNCYQLRSNMNNNFLSNFFLKNSV